MTFRACVVAASALFGAVSAVTRVTCIGDSITSGGSCVPESYVDNLRELLGDGYEVLNAGVSSMTQLKMGLCNDLSPCSYWDTDAWQSALTSQPDIVTIMLGTNDAKYFNWEGIQQSEGDFYALDYVDMIRSLRSLRPAPRVFIMVPPPLYEPYPFDMNQTIINNVFPSLIRDISAVMDTEIVDIFSAFNSSDLLCDGCHPTAEGNAIIANEIFKSISK